MKDEKKYTFRDNFSGDSYKFENLREAKQAAKHFTYGNPIYIFKDRDIVAVVNPNEKPLP